MRLTLIPNLILSGAILTSLSACAGSPARNMIDLRKSMKASKPARLAKAAENKKGLTDGTKAGLIFVLARDGFRGSVPCNTGTMEFKNTETGQVFESSFHRVGAGMSGPRMVVLDPGSYIPTKGKCGYVVDKNEYRTKYAREVPFIVLAKDTKPVTLGGGELVYPGTYKFNQVKGPVFSFEYEIPKKRDYRDYAERRYPDLADRYRNSYNSNETSP